MKGKYSSPNPIVADPMVNREVPPATNQKGRSPQRLRRAPIAASTAPVARRTANVPPMMKTKKMISCAPLKPLGMAVSQAAGDNAGASGVRWKLPGTTCSRPAAFSTRSKDPAGSRYVRTWATITIPKRKTRVCGTLSLLFVTMEPLFSHLRPWARPPCPDYLRRGRFPAQAR